ncbi:MAG: hypothetical protein WBH03_23285 [Cyclobacteriaceae bacterium]
MKRKNLTLDALKVSSFVINQPSHLKGGADMEIAAGIDTSCGEPCSCDC